MITLPAREEATPDTAAAAPSAATEDRHTPGPRRTDPDMNHEAVLGADGLLVADCAILGATTELMPERNQANARLIAAAPDLLTALRKAHHVLASSHGLYASDLDWETRAAHRANGETVEFVTDFSAEIAEIDAAIAKAEGRT